MSIKFDKEKEKLSLKNKGLTDDKVINDLISLKENTPHLLKSKIPCEMYDKINLMCRMYMDRMARFEVDYDFLIDEAAFKNVAICFLECAPFMHSKVINHPITPYWKVCDYHIDDMVTVKTVNDIEKARKEFFSQSIPLSSNIQIKIGIFYYQEKTYICFIWNHMGFDGGGYKAFWSDFCKNYTDYVLYDKSPVSFSTGSRNYKLIYKDMGPDFAKKAKKQLANISPKDNHILPFENLDKTDNVIIVSREVESETFSKVIKNAKIIGGTVNDILLAAYIDALGKVSGMLENESISVACATDLRRHIKDLSDIGYTNHVSFIHCAIDEKGSNIHETLKKVSAKTKELKKDPYIGLHGLPLLTFASKSMWYFQAEVLVTLFYKNPTLC